MQIQEIIDCPANKELITQVFFPKEPENQDRKKPLLWNGMAQRLLASLARRLS